MAKQSSNDKFAAITVAGLLLLTAWGNANAMLIFGALGLVIGVLFFRKNLGRGAMLAATVGCVVAILIALAAKLR